MADTVERVVRMKRKIIKERAEEEKEERVVKAKENQVEKAEKGVRANTVADTVADMVADTVVDTKAAMDTKDGDKKEVVAMEV